MLFVLCILFMALCFLTYYKKKRISFAFLCSFEWTALSILVLIFGFPANEWAILFVWICTVAFSLSFLLHPGKVSRGYLSESNRRILEEELVFRKSCIIAMVIHVLALVCLLYTIASEGLFEGVDSFMFQIESLIRSGYLARRDLPFFNRLVNSFIYAICGYGGFYAAYRWRAIYIVHIGLLWLQGILASSKAILVFGVAFWLGGYVTGMIFFKKRISFRKFICGIGIISALIALSVFINWIRWGSHTNIVFLAKRIVAEYIIGPYSAFSLWFANFDGSSFEGGTNTFACIARILGIKAQTHGEMIGINGYNTNVYTIFKHLLNDYSYWGTVILSGCIGFLGMILDRFIENEKVAAVGFHIVLLSAIFVAFFSSIFRYTINVVAAILIIVSTIVLGLYIGREGS